MNVGSLIWARLFFFKIKSSISRKISYFNDFAVAIQIVSTCYFFYSEEVGLQTVIFSAPLYVGSLAIFWWAIATAGKLDFASGSLSGKLLTKGPYALARHPFYLSYSALWITSTLVCSSLAHWLSLSVLLCVYYVSAKNEESAILNGNLSNDYLAYKKETGMFWPKLSSKSKS